MNSFLDDLVASLTEGQSSHLGRVTSQHVGLVQSKYSAGQIEHGGNCYEKPGMLAHALDETADLTVYLWTLKEQMLALAARLRDDDDTIDPYEAADEIERWLRK